MSSTYKNLEFSFETKRGAKYLSLVSMFIMKIVTLSLMFIVKKPSPKITLTFLV